MNKRMITSLLAILLMSVSSCGTTPTQQPTDQPTEQQPTEKPTVTENHEVLDLDLSEAPKYQEDSIMFHYWRNDGKYSNWDMWLWEVNNAGAGYSWNGKDDWGVVAAYPLSTWSDSLLSNGLGFIVRKGGDSWAEKDLSQSDLFVDFSAFEKDENGIYHIYLKSGDSNLYIDDQGSLKASLKLATFANEKSISVSGNVKMESLKLYKDDQVIFEEPSVGKVTYTNITLKEEIDYKSSYKVEVKFINGDVRTMSVSKVLLFNSKFDEKYAYDGNDLGATLTADSTTFKVWSPLSNKISVRIYNNGTPTSVDNNIGNDEYVEYEMTADEKGVFSYVVDQNLEGKYYTYVVTNSEYSEREVVDPYAKSAGVNGLRGMVVDFSKTNPMGWDSVIPHPYDRKQLTVYETHVADVTSSVTWTGNEQNRKLFGGMYESGTTYTQDGVTVTTGFDHIKELGVNAVQLIPIYDQANDEVNMTFNWGYNPLNYNCLEGGYSSNPHDGYTRIREFKELVKAYNEAGINIIMDVVYNHTSGAIGSNFDVLMPGYYYRYDNNAGLSNGSGCGNETASERQMMRKFMIDSVDFWTEEYKLGGFRFDLMGLHDLKTMELLTASAKEINKNIVIYGEPWTGGTAALSDGESAKQLNGNKYVGYGAFNDQMRDALIKGGLSGNAELGWITNNKSEAGNADLLKITRGIQGTTSASSIIADPDKTVNYVTCHDNYTLYDRIIATGKFTAEDEEKIAKMNVLANSIVMTSLGTSFMLAGEEFLRTKGGDHNSYMSSYEVNELDYALKVKHLDMFETYKKLIYLKQNLDGLHLGKDNASAIIPTVSANKAMISYLVSDSTNNLEYMIIHKNGLNSVDTLDLSGYSLYYSTIYGNNKELTENTNIDLYETLIVYKQK